MFLQRKQGLSVIENANRGPGKLESLEFLDTVPLEAIYDYLAHLGQDNEIIAWGGYAEDTRVVSVYIKRAA
jgi:hypothetical protein